MNEHTLKIISTFSGLVPVIAGMILFKKAGKDIRLFYFLMLYGVLTDLGVWYLKDGSTAIIAESIFYIYAPVEAIIFCWLISLWTVNEKIKIASRISAGIWIILWFFLHVDLHSLTWYEEPECGLFVSLYEMVVAWLAGASILLMTRGNKSIYSQAPFWILTGIFFYCFCTFSVTTLGLSKSMVDKVWFFHNSINIITSFIYAYGLLKIEIGSRSRKTEPEFN